MLKLISIIKPYSVVILAIWMIAILVVSSIPDIPTLKLHTPKKDVRLDYLIHICEYGLLAFLAYLAFAGKNFRTEAGRFTIVTAGLFVFAVADELHQKFIPGRTFNPRDMISNFLGILISLVFSIMIFRMIRKQQDQ